MALHVKKGDTVIVLAGKDIGKKGKILKVFTSQRKVLVDGVNIVKKHTRPRPPKIPHGGILEKAMPIDSSNVMLVCTECNKPTRIAKQINKETNTKVRICKKCGKEIC